MNIIKHISTIIFAAIVFVGSVGMYVIKDTCAPCGEIEMTAQMVLADYDSICNENEDSCCGEKEEECCSYGNEQEHKHEQKASFFQRIPEYFQANISLDLKPITYLIAVIISHTDLDVVASNITHQDFFSKFYRSGTSYRLSLLCTYLI